MAKPSRKTTLRSKARKANQPGTSAKRLLSTEDDAREVLFVIPAQLARAYFLLLYGHCEERISNAIPSLRPILRCVHSESDEEIVPGKVASILQREVRWQPRSRIAAIVIAPTESIEMERHVAEFSAEHQIPIVALSLQFPSGTPFAEHELPEPPYVIADGNEACRVLGKHAAERVHQLSRRKHLDVVFIPGDKLRRDSRERIASFEEGFRSAGGTKSRVRFLPELPSCKWQRRRAMEAMGSFLRKEELPSVVFAASDQMALGACDSLQQRGVKSRSVSVYGFDAIPEVRARLLDPSEPYLCGTVDQNTSVMATRVVELLREMIAVDEPHRRTWRPHVVKADHLLGQRGLRSNDEPPLYRFSEIDKWVSIEDAAKITGDSKSMLAQYRTAKKYSADRRGDNDDQSLWGEDTKGRIWRKSPFDLETGQERKGIVYWLPSLGPAKS